jgi:hypothetical protein
LPIWVGIAHGTIGVVGLGLLLFALQGPARGVDAGVASFGTTSAALFAGAALTGVVMLRMRRRAIVMAVHAGIAITGYVLLLAWYSLG